MATVGGVLAVWQGSALTEGDVRWVVIFAGVAAAALLTQALMSIGMAIGAVRAHKKAMAVLDEVRTAAMPVLAKSNALIDELSPKVREIAENVAQISAVTRSKVASIEPTVDAINRTVTNANRRTNAQIDRVDGMVTGTLNATAEIASMIYMGIQTPLREVSGLVSGLKAGLATFLGAQRSAAKPIAAVQPIRNDPAPDAAHTAAAEARNEISFAEYRAAMQAKRKDLEL